MTNCNNGINLILCGQIIGGLGSACILSYVKWAVSNEKPCDIGQCQLLCILIAIPSFFLIVVGLFLVVRCHVLEKEGEIRNRLKSASKGRKIGHE